MELISVENGRVRFAGHNIFTATGETLVVRSELRFRSQAELSASLITTGFTVEQVYGNWQRGPVTSVSRVMVFIARRTT